MNSPYLHMHISDNNLTPPAPVLYCYVCEDCPEDELSPLRHMRACPDDSHVSCIATLTTFAEYKSKYLLQGDILISDILIPAIS